MRRDRDGAHETVNEWQTSQCVIPKSGHRFFRTRSHTNEKCVCLTVFGKSCAIDSGFERQGYWGKERESSHDDNGNPLGLVTYWALKSDVTS